ncbi:hypothetical protein ACHAXT_012703 [Thalassiosira profunda]
MGFKLRRRKSARQQPVASGPADPFPAGASLGNSTITTKQTAASPSRMSMKSSKSGGVFSKRGLFPGKSPNGGSPGSLGLSNSRFVDEVESPQPLPLLGLSIPEFGTGNFDQGGGPRGSFDRTSPADNNAESPGSVFEGISRAWAAPGTPESPHMAALPPSGADTRSKRGRLPKPRGGGSRRFLGRRPQDPPELTSNRDRSSSARNLKAAMEQEISRHRGSREPSPIAAPPGDPMANRSLSLSASANSQRSSAVLAAAGAAVVGAGAVAAVRSSSFGRFWSEDEDSKSFWSGEPSDLVQESGAYDDDEETEGTYDDEASLDSYEEASYVSGESYEDHEEEAGRSVVAEWFGFGGAKEDVQGEESLDRSYSSGGSSRSGDKVQVAVQTSKGSVNNANDEEETHDREGRPMPRDENLAVPKALVKRPSFREKLKSLKPPLSPGASKRAHRGADDAKSVNVSAASTAASTRSKGSRWSASAEKSVVGVTKRGKEWDDDKRQRDVYCPRCGDAENLVVRQHGEVLVLCAADEVLIKVEASTVSSKDCYVRLMGEPGDAPDPAVPGFHVVGTVEAVGTKVGRADFQEGDRVAALLPKGGGNAKYVSIPAWRAVLLPEDADHEDIICLVANYVTAYQCLKLAKKDSAPLTNANVLVTGGSGPVGQALVELALTEGANVYATAHKMHEEHLTKLGAKWFNVKPKKWLPQLEGRMDVVIDSLCVDGYESSYRALTSDGILVCNTGNSSSLLRLQNDPAFCNAFDDNGLHTWWSGMKARFFWNRAVFYDLNDSFEANPRMFEQELRYLICKLERGEVRPKVAGRVSLNQVPKAQKLIEKGLPNGTVVCQPWKKLDPKQKVKVEKKANC